MPAYLATGRYRSTAFSFEAGEVVTVDPAHVAGLVDAPIDFTRALTPAEVAEAQTRRNAEREAAAAAEREAARAISDHTRAWGGKVCPSHGPIRPAGWTTYSAAPHDADELTARNHDGVWFVACSLHIDRIVRSGTVPTPPSRPDTTLRRYRARWRFHDAYTEVMPDDGDSAPAVLGFGGVIDLAENAEFTAPVWLAAWIDRNSPGVLVEIGPDGEPIIGLSTEEAL